MYSAPYNEMEAYGGLWRQAPSLPYVDPHGDLTVSYRMKQKKKFDALRNPDRFAQSARALLTDEFGVPEQRDISSLRSSGVKFGGRRKVAGTSSFGLGLPKENRENPSLPLPPINPADLSKGLLHLVNKGYVPHTMDLTSAIFSSPAPVVQEPLQLHPHREQFERRQFMTSEFGFDTSGIKLDLVSQAKPRHVHSSPALRPPITTTHRGGPTAEDMLARIPPPPEPQHVPPPPPPIEPEEPRSYHQLLDAFSLHQFIIRRGKVLDTTPEFLSFKRTFASVWGAVSFVVQALESLLSEFGVPLAYVDGKRVVDLARDDLEPPTQEQLLSCLTNKDQVEAIIKQPGQKLGRRKHTRERNDRANTAATVIQAHVRGHLARQKYSMLKACVASVVIIQRWWKRKFERYRTARHLSSKLEQEENTWRETIQKPFVEKWPSLSANPPPRRTIVFIPSLSYTPAQRASFSHQQRILENSHLCRLFEAFCPLTNQPCSLPPIGSTISATTAVDVIFLTAQPIDNEAIQYHTKLIQAFVPGNIESKVKVVCCESAAKLPARLSLASLVLYSDRTLKRISAMCSGKLAYIVPAVVGTEDLRLAVKLGLPLLGPEPTNGQVYRTKSGAKRIFTGADVNVPPGYHDVYEEKQVLSSLSRLITQFPEYTRWLLKIDNEFGGRGTAYLDVSSLRTMKDASKIESMLDAEAVRDRLYDELESSLRRKAVIVRPDAYPTWEDFVYSFSMQGGVIEACPQKVVANIMVNLFVSPNGQPQVTSFQEPVFSAPFQVIGATSFQSTSVVPPQALAEAAEAIGAMAFRKGCFGYMTVDFVVFLDQTEHLRMWAVDIKMHLTTTAAMHSMVHCLTKDSSDHTPLTPSVPRSLPTMSDRCYLYSGLLFHRNMSSIRHAQFFTACRQKNIAFDVQNFVGTLFHLPDSLLRGVLGFLCIGRTLNEAATNAQEAFEFLQHQITLQGPLHSSDGSNWQEFSAGVKSIVEAQLGPKTKTRKSGSAKSIRSARD